MVKKLLWVAAAAGAAWVIDDWLARLDRAEIEVEQLAMTLERVDYDGLSDWSRTVNHEIAELQAFAARGMDEFLDRLAVAYLKSRAPEGAAEASVRAQTAAGRRAEGVRVQRPDGHGG